jgi:hypothetical protein
VIILNAITNPWEYESSWFPDLVMARPPAAAIPDCILAYTRTSEVSRKGEKIEKSLTYGNEEKNTGDHGRKCCSTEYSRVDVSEDTVH